jgi:hypothetical protein
MPHPTGRPGPHRAGAAGAPGEARVCPADHAGHPLGVERVRGRFAAVSRAQDYGSGLRLVLSPGTTLGATVGRDAFLTPAAERWEELDPAEYPFLTRAATDLRGHDDREQFVTGLDLLLNGLGTGKDARPPV